MNNLLPCPFCGGEAEFERMGTPRQSCIVACTDCGGRFESNEEGGACGSQWNDRHVPDGWQMVPRLLLEELANDLEAELKHEHIDHPVTNRRLEVDMGIVRQAREILGGRYG